MSQPVHNKGQSLIEVMVAITVAAVVLGALITLILNGLKNAEFAQNQIKATKYAQETVDKIKAVRDQDGSVTVNNTSCNITRFSDLFKYYLSSNPSTSGTCNASPCNVSSPPTPLLSDGCYFIFDSNGVALIEVTPGNLSSYYPAVNSPSDGFSRFIKFTDTASGTQCPNATSSRCDYTNEKTITVQIQWTDGAGSHRSNLQTILSPRL